MVTRATKSVMDFFVVPSFQDGSGSVCASAGVERNVAINAGTAAIVDSMKRRLGRAG